MTEVVVNFDIHGQEPNPFPQLFLSYSPQFWIGETISLAVLADHMPEMKQHEMRGRFKVMDVIQSFESRYYPSGRKDIHFITVTLQRAK